MPFLTQKTENQASTSSDASLLKCRIVGRRMSSVTISNAGPNSIDWHIDVSNDSQGKSGSWGTEKTAATLTSGSSTSYVVSGCFGWVDVIIKDTSGGSHGSVSAYLIAAGI